MSPAPAPRFISTLRKELLQTLDRFDISNQRLPAIRTQWGKSIISYATPRRKGSPRFPPNTLGYFYFHIPPKAPALAGEIRFRCADSLDRFNDGHDLISNDSYAPWSILPYKLGTCSNYASFRKQLVLDNLLSQSTFDVWAQVKTPTVKYHSGNRPMLYYLTQPFFLRFDDAHIVLYSTRKEKVSVCVAVSPLVETHSDPDRWYVFPYGGVGLVRLEPYVCPRRPQSNMVALRVLKIIQPVQQLLASHILQPTEGMLVQRLKLRNNEPVVVTRDLGKASSMKDLLGLPVNFDDL